MPDKLFGALFRSVALKCRRKLNLVIHHYPRAILADQAIVRTVALPHLRMLNKPCDGRDAMVDVRWRWYKFTHCGGVVRRALHFVPVRDEEPLLPHIPRFNGRVGKCGHGHGPFRHCPHHATLVIQYRAINVIRKPFLNSRVDPVAFLQCIPSLNAVGHFETVVASPTYCYTCYYYTIALGRRIRPDTVPHIGERRGARGGDLVGTAFELIMTIEILLPFLYNSKPVRHLSKLWVETISLCVLWVFEAFVDEHE